MVLSLLIVDAERESTPDGSPEARRDLQVTREGYRQAVDPDVK